MYEELNIEAVEDECFAEKVKLWIWLLALAIFVIIILSITNFFSKKRASLKKTWNVHQIAMQVPYQVNRTMTGVRWVGMQGNATRAAFQPCPYCDGTLDPQGRCNVPGCPLYNPTWGTGAQQAALQQGVMPGRVNKPGSPLIKELAMEVYQANGFPGIYVHSVYLNGWAQKAGLKKGDIVVKFNGRRVKTVKSLVKAIGLAIPELQVKIQYIRDGIRRKSMIMVGEGELEGAIPVNAAVAYQPRRQGYQCPVR